MLLRTAATSELVVPRSMPTASGAGGAPATCRVRKSGAVPWYFFLETIDRLARVVFDLLDKHQLSCRLASGAVVVCIEQRAERRMAFELFLTQVAQQASS
jgi:hypothetical protein